MKQKPKVSKPLLEPERSREYLNNPDSWIRWPYCPLTRGMENAVLCHSGTTYQICVGANLWSLGDLDGEIWQDITVDKVIADGWRVD